MAKTVVLLMLLVLTVVIAAVALSKKKEAPVTRRTIDIREYMFTPATLEIKMGSTVTWVNNDQISHQIKSIFFNSAELTTGQSFSYTFNNPGIFDYTCSIHPEMSGKIVVK